MVYIVSGVLLLLLAIATHRALALIGIPRAEGERGNGKLGSKRWFITEI